jgi:hypothetical protein
MTTTGMYTTTSTPITTTLVTTTVKTCNCSSGQYCADTNESCSESHPSGRYITLDYQTYETITFNNGDLQYIASKSPLSWWDANSLCTSLGKSIVTDHELVGTKRIKGRTSNGYDGYITLAEALNNKGMALNIWMDKNTNYTCNAPVYDLENKNWNYAAPNDLFWTICQ